MLTFNINVDTDLVYWPLAHTPEEAHILASELKSGLSDFFAQHMDWGAFFPAAYSVSDTIYANPTGTFKDTLLPPYAFNVGLKAGQKALLQINESSHMRSAGGYYWDSTGMPVVFEVMMTAHVHRILPTARQSEILANYRASRVVAQVEAKDTKPIPLDPYQANFLISTARIKKTSKHKQKKSE